MTSQPVDHKRQPRVVIVGAGFGGLTAAQRIARLPVQVIVVDKKNHHTFQPLLYQVATAGLSPGEIAAPIRSILRARNNVEVLLEEVLDFDLNENKVVTREQALDYDFLIVASGAAHAYFGHEEWEPYAPGLKTIEDALEIRRRVLLAFELAERQAAEGQKVIPLQFVVVGGGPTGVELAGTLAEIAHHAMNHEFRNIDPRQSRILLIEGGPRVLPAYSEALSRKAEDQLRHLGVDVRTSSMVTGVDPGVDLAVLTLSHLEPAPRGHEYRAWASHGGRWSLLGRAQLDNDGRSLMIAEGPELAIPPDQLQVTLEPIGARAGAGAVPTGPPVIRWPAP
jgi:NADH dehydrogenase